jgi:hypothetical protein
MKFPQTFLGEYTFDRSAAFPPVPFTLCLSRSICGGFRGRITEDPVLGIPHPAQIRGRIRSRRIAFRKDYRGAPFTVAGDAGHELFDDYVVRQFGVRPSLSLHHPPIFYFGRIDEAGQRIEGRWTILSEVVPLSDGRVLPLPRSCGHFRLHAKKA